MAIDTAAFSKMLAKHGGPNQSGIVGLMLCSEPTPECQDADNWAALCEFVMAQDEEHNFSKSDQERFDCPEPQIRVDMALEDNDIVGAIAAVKMGLHKKWPLVAWAASNKHSFPGFSGAGTPEIAVMRFLQWAGADLTEAEWRHGMTALHYMASTKYMPGSDVRAVKWLLESGAGPGAKNWNGFTAMSYLCGSSVWGEAQRETFVLLLRAGCRPLQLTLTDTTPLETLRANQIRWPIELRQTLIDSLESDIRQAQPGFFARMLGLGKGRVPNIAWTATLGH